MNTSFFRNTLLALAALSLPHTANATLLVGWHAFDLSTTPEAADVAASGYSGLVTKGGETSVSFGGSNDRFYGDSTIPTGPSPAANNGYARILNTSLTFSLNNVSGGTTSLTSLLFDAANFNGGGAVTVQYQIGAGGPLVTLGTKSPLPDSGPVGTFVDYGDYAFSLVGVPLLSVGQTINFIFTSTNARIDNIAVTGISAIPEVGSLLALGCLVGSGTLLRSRRRFVAPLRMA